MAGRSASYLAVILIIISCTGIRSQDIIQGPVHTAATNGNPSKLNCQVENLGIDSIVWTFFPNGTRDANRVYAYFGADATEDPPNDDYDIDKDVSAGVFNLEVINTSPSMAGVYECSLFKVNKKEEAEFVSVAPIGCDPPPGEREVLEGASLLMTCDVGYTGYRPPAVTWFRDGGTFVGGDYTYNWERASVTANVTAVAELDETEFICELFFENEVPKYNDTCSTYFKILHRVTNIEIFPDPDPGGPPVPVIVGDLVNCTASGRPDPVFSWTGDDDEFVSGPSLEILFDWAGMTKTFTCIAENEPQGQPATASLPITVFVNEAAPTQPVKTGGVETWVIVVAVVVPLVVLAGAGGGAYAYIRHRKKKKKEGGGSLKPMPGPPQNGRPFTDIVRPANTRMPGGPKPVNGQTTMMGGVPVVPPAGTETSQNNLSGRDSPGYGDLGIKQFSSTNALDASVEMDPNPKFYVNTSQGSGRAQPQNMGSQGSLGPRRPQPRARGPMGSQGSINQMYPAQGVMGSQGSLGPRQNMYPAQGMMGSQGSLGPRQNMYPAQGMMGSQGSLGPGQNHLPPARAGMGSQGSINRILAAHGNMGSQRSLASQGSQGYNQRSYHIHDAPDTTV